MPDKKKIIHIIHGLGQGGAERTLFNLLKTMPDSHYEFGVIVFGNPSFYSSHIEALGIPIYYLNVRKINLIKATYRLTKLLRKTRPDIVQTWLYYSDLLGGISAKLCRVKRVIWGIRCEGINLKKSTTVLKKCCATLSWIIPHSIVSNSSVAAQKHIQSGYSAKKMHVIHNGYDPEQYAPQKNRDFLKQLTNKTIPEDALIIGTLARYHHDKDYLTLIRAIDAICELHPKAYFVFCGQGCNETNEHLNKHLSSLRYKENVLLINGTDKVPTYLNTLDIFVLSSKTESFPNSLAEAMLCGLPCIATDVGEVREMVGNAGIIIPSQNSQELITACLTLITQSKEQRTQLEHLARNRIKQSYSIENNIKKFDTIYQQSQ